MSHKSSKARSKNWKKRLLSASCPSICPHGRVSLPLDGFSWKFKKIHIWLKSEKITGTLHEDLCTYILG